MAKKVKIEQQISKFINAIHGDYPFEIRIMSKDKYNTMRSILFTKDSIYINNQSKKKTKIAEHTASNLGEVLELEYFYSQGGEVFLTVNSPNIELMDSCFTSDEHIINGGIINSHFIDIDAPKEIKENELNLKIWKKQVKDKLLAFSLRPSMVVDTKNGYHVYWLLENGNHQLFRQVQMQLIHYFDGDKKCINESRILRLPGFQHRKDPKHPYPVTLKIFEPDSRYSQEQLMNALPKLEEETMNKILSSTIKSEPILMFWHTTMRTNFTAILLSIINFL
ncbi:DNA-primase RepB domain-containing protein [Psychrobacillus sp. NPDC096426]|uniref:DNA-primase RepB domain-containing protein n=1 Tax=Psychrobacillus sp. NPDC096426 TaxID=3364491 RepID=UPI0038096FD5